MRDAAPRSPVGVERVERELLVVAPRARAPELAEHSLTLDSRLSQRARRRPIAPIISAVSSSWLPGP